MKVFKFGGASVNSASAVKNMTEIIRKNYGEPLAVVISAMGKTTNLLEKLVPQNDTPPQNLNENISQLSDYHTTIIKELFGDKAKPVLTKFKNIVERLETQIHTSTSDYNYNYDHIVSFGELISTTIVSEYLNFSGLENTWFDVRTLIKTDASHREGKVDWSLTQSSVNDILVPFFDTGKMAVTQGFIAGTSAGDTTTLGREGSDYSASILSYCLDAESMTIWKDVPGFLNADPKFFDKTIKIKQIPYNEAIELTYYGASVIHPKTLKPLQNKNIPLYVKSFITPENEGSAIGNFAQIDPLTPLYIFKNNQVLLSISPKDFSFIAEDSLQTIFGHFANIGIKINLMQNSALSFSVCVDYNERLFNNLVESLLQNNFSVRYNTNLQLITMRYYNEQTIEDIVAGRKILLEQRSRTTTQIVVEEKKATKID